MSLRVPSVAKIPMFMCVVAVLLAQSACNLVSSVPKQATATPSPIEYPMAVPHQPYRVAEIWLSVMQTYPQHYRDQAKQQIAQAIDDAVQPNSDGMFITINLISSNSFKPEATVLTMIIPALPADPMPPQLQPSPTPTGDPFTDAQVRKQVASDNTLAQQQYQQVLRQQHTHLAAVRKQIHSLTDQLRQLTPSLDPGMQQDLWGAFGRAAKHFTGVIAPKLFILATSLDRTSWTQFTPDLYLPGVVVSVIDEYCGQTQAVCEQSTGFWKKAFLHAGASSVSITDLAQLAALSLFSSSTQEAS